MNGPMRGALALLAALAVGLSPSRAAAQGGAQGGGRGGTQGAGQRGRAGVRPGVPLEPGMRRGGRAAVQPPAGGRALMEQRITDRVNNIIRVRLALSDEQFQQLREMSARFESDRRALRRDELTNRAALRQELLGASANETRVAELLETLPKLERRRLDMMEQEQRELARFLSPSQRARYFALQDELRRNLQDVQRRRLGGGGPPPALDR